MSISGVSSALAAAKAQQAQPTVPAKAPDGDHKVAGSNTSKTKDADGDYKLVRGTLALSTSGVQAALSKLKAGG